jgi:hypothetical protein
MFLDNLFESHMFHIHTVQYNSDPESMTIMTSHLVLNKDMLTQASVEHFPKWNIFQSLNPASYR